MTGAEFSEVDIDLLADYVGGALDGTPDEAVVAALITEDTGWRDAHARLSAATATVTDQLGALGSAAEPMPAEVFARLDAALLGAAGAESVVERLATAADQQTGGRAAGSGQIASIDDRSSGAPVAPAAMEPGSDGAAPARHLVAVPSGSRGRRARHLRWAAPVGIAAGVLAFAGFGLQQLSDGSADTTSSAGSAEAPRAAAGQELSLPGGSARIVESGTDYRLDSLGRDGDRAMTAPDAAQGQPGTLHKDPPSAGVITAIDPLDRLRVQEALRACIEAIAAQHGAGEIVPRTIDFARFNGSPAVIVEFTAAGGSWVWASGPACGTPGVGAAKLGSVKVG